MNSDRRLPPPRRPPSYQPAIAPPRNARAPRQDRYDLTPQQRRFVEELLVDADVRLAAPRAGLTVERGRALLGTTRVQDALAFARRRRLSRLDLYADDSLLRWVALANADVNELVEVRRVNCRHCHGQDHEYQYDDLEHRHARTKHLADQMALPDEARTPFDDAGGPGFNRNAPPAADCPRCAGDGELRVIIKDTRNLTLGGRLLYDGVKVGPGGAIEVKLRDRAWAEGMIARHAGMFAMKNPVEEFDPNKMTDDQLDAVTIALVERGVVEIEGEVAHRGALEGDLVATPVTEAIVTATAYGVDFGDTDTEG